MQQETQPAPDRGGRPYYEPPTVPVLPDDLGELPPDEPLSLPPSRRPRSPQPRGRWGCLRTFSSLIGMLLLALLGTGAVIGLVLYNSLNAELKSDLDILNSMQGVETFQTSRIVDRNGALLYELINEGRREEVPLDRIPFAMRQATIATEDDTFYDNPGFDPPSIARAASQWITEGKIVTGGSTITQQLIRQIVFSYTERNQQTLRRKAKEIALAWVMTQQYSKDDILALYLNEVYYGNLAYGVEAAAQTYFGKHAADLSIAESAFLAGLVQSPATYDPYTNFDLAKARQRDVLNLLVRHGYLEQSVADAAFAESPTSVDDLVSPNVQLQAPHFTVEVRRALAELPIDPVYIAQGGLIITTALDLRIQTIAEQIVAQRVAEVRETNNLHNAALVAINPNTGEVLAMVGSVDYNDKSIDGNVNVTMSQRQPGSTMKPLTYAAAMELGWLPSDILWDVPIQFKSATETYVPRNYDGRFHGPVRVRDALANSYNIPAVLTLQAIGVPALLDFAGRVGIKSLGDDPSLYGLSLTLGGGEVTPLEMVSAYSAFANGGREVTPVFISKVTDLNGNVLYAAPSGLGDQVIDPRIAYMITDILADNTARTPAMGANSELHLDFPAAAKTGTTNDYRDNWTIGYTPHLAVVVWAGNTDDTPMAEGTSGLIGAAPIWHDFMTIMHTDPTLSAVIARPDLPLGSDFPRPVELEKRPVCSLFSLHDPQIGSNGCPRYRNEWFPTVEIRRNPQPAPMPTATATASVDPVTGTRLPAARLQIEKGIWAMGVVPISQEMRQAYFASLPDGAISPLYCAIPPDATNMAGVSTQIFIAPPSDPAEALAARKWAYEHSLPILPDMACPQALVDQLKSGMPAGIPGAGYSIDWPVGGQGVYGVIPILGSVTFDPASMNFWKLEIGEGTNPTGWVTFGSTHTGTITGGLLEELHSDALTPGPYVIRLVIVTRDAGILPPFSVPITILAEPPTPTPQP
jgi:1A family penicillin-binding protein